jgi:dTDP-4-amino-4,6-dideoxygalactose transaminase
MNIQMVDLKGQYAKIKAEIDAALLNAVNEAEYINGTEVKLFQRELEEYTGATHAIPCANGTDALQIALMALNLQSGDEVIVPAFTYVASAEVIGLLRLTPVMVDVDLDSFNLTLKNVENGLSSKTKAIIPVHLFGQSCDMEGIMNFAREHKLHVIEDNAQAIGARYTFADDGVKQTGTIGQIGCTSFFPSKNLGCFGDGGAMTTDDEELAKRLRMIASHGQSIKYRHDVLGCNSRLDTLQAAILRVKLRYLDQYCKARQEAARRYNEMLSGIEELILPVKMSYSTHVYHQYTVRLRNARKRDELKSFLGERDVPSMIYYPLPLQQQAAFKSITRKGEDLHNAELLSASVLSLPMHTELQEDEQAYVCEQIIKFFKR